ncbi:MAG: amidase [Rhodospirillaceae bacterium]|nr:amidase [Rhodospirillaceae bacterium]
MTRAWQDSTALELGRGIAAGSIDPVELTEFFLDRIAQDDPNHLVYLRTTRDRALAEAKAARDRAAAGLRLGPLDGVPISWKDLYDTAGIETAMGSPQLAGRIPERDALVLERATRAGMVCLGKTNLVEFALGGLGINNGTGTPPNACDDVTPRCPGGSSSGAATSVARGLAVAAIGSDTGGSVRIPASWNGLVGLKTTFGALPLDGVMALSPSLDTVGPLTRDVADANAIFAAMAAAQPADLSGADIADQTFLVADSIVWDKCDPSVAQTVEAAIAALEAAGAKVERAPVPEFDEIDDVLNRHGGLVVAEGYHSWRHCLDDEAKLARVDPVVRDRMMQGKAMTATDIAIAREEAARIGAALHHRMTAYSAVLAPTVPILPPAIADVATDAEAYGKANMAALNNTRLGNVLTLCALTIPCGQVSGLPVGLMLMGRPGTDNALLRIGAAAEPVLRDLMA